MTLAELYRELERHDWFYAMSDDPRVYSAGRENLDRLEREAMSIEGGPELRQGFIKHIFSGEPWGTPKAPKPEMPGVLAENQSQCFAPEQEYPGQDAERNEP